MTHPAFKLKVSSPLQTGMFSLLLFFILLPFNTYANGGRSLEWLQNNLIRTKNGPRITQALEESAWSRLESVDDEFRAYWQRTYGREATSETRTLTRDTMLAEEDLLTLDRILSRQFRKEIELAKEAERVGWETARNNARRSAIDLDEELAATVKRPAREAARESRDLVAANSQTTGLFARMNECLAKETRLQAEERNHQAVWGQMIRSGVLTAGGTFTRDLYAGAYELVFKEAAMAKMSQDDFYKHFSFDMAWGLMSTYLKSKYVNFKNDKPSLATTLNPQEFSKLSLGRRAWESQDPIFVRWWQGLIIDAGRTAAEPVAHFYWIEVADHMFPDGSHLSEEAEKSRDDDIYNGEKTKFIYNATWNGVTSPISPTISHVMRGIRCINGNNLASRAGTWAGSFGVSFAQSGVYFFGRQYWVGY